MAVVPSRSVMMDPLIFKRASSCAPPASSSAASQASLLYHDHTIMLQGLPRLQHVRLDQDRQVTRQQRTQHVHEGGRGFGIGCMSMWWCVGVWGWGVNLDGLNAWEAGDSM